MELIKFSDFNNDQLNQLNESYGVGVLNTFLKSLTALGLKENKPSEDVPTDFLMIFRFSKLNSSDVESIFKRFKSLSGLEIKFDRNLINLYFGIKNDMIFEYGYYFDDIIKIGLFKINKSIFNKLKTSELKSLSGFKKSMVDLTYNDLLIMSKLRKEITNIEIGWFDKISPPVIKDNIISFGYYGLGKWSNGIIDENDLIEIKNNVKKFISKYKWSNSILLNVKANNFWVYLNFKIKD